MLPTPFIEDFHRSSDTQRIPVRQMKTPTATKTQPKRRAFASGPTRNGATGAKAKTENPFDKFANARKKHEVLNRRVKGEDRNMGRAREKAIDERKTKLLKDYQSSKKSNTVLDKRFGESDPTLSLEERMFMRFQKEKVKHVRNSSSFNLESGDTEVLTHRGQVLGNSNLEDNDWVSSDEEEGKTGGLNKQVVDSLHFGGGLQHKRGGNTEELPQKGRLDALQEIVMKSKLHKMQKKEAREEQEDERTKIDKAYQELFAGSMLEFNKEKNDRKSGRGDRAGAPESAEDLDDYDQALKEMTYEAKLPASERTKSAEEIALAEQKRIEELEEARIQRMKQAHWAAKHPNQKAGNDAEEEDTRANKRKHRTDDEIDDSAFAPTAIKANKRASRKEAAAEDLEANNAAYNEYIMQDEEYEDSSEEEGSEGEEGSDEEEDDEEGSEQSEGEDGDSEEDNEEEDDQSEGSSDPEGEEEENEDELDGSDMEEESEAEEEVKPVKKAKGVAFAAGTAAPAESSAKAPKTKKVASEDDVNIEMPHKIDCPPDLEAFDELVDQYVKDPNLDMKALIERILAWNNVNLPGAEGKENRNLMHNFLDVLLKHFMRVGDSLAKLDLEGQKGTQAQLDYLSGAIFKVSNDISEVTCAALWGRTIKILHSQLQKRLRDYAQGEREVSCWPSLGRLLLMQLLGRVFSVTDLKNDVVGPASLLLCQCLSQCPVSSTADLASGLLASSVLVSYHAETKKYVPEVVSFVHTVLSLYIPNVGEEGSARRAQDHQGTFNLSTLAASRSDLARLSKQATVGKIHWSYFALKASDEKKAAEAAAGIVSSAYAMVDTIVELYKSQAALPEILLPIIDTLKAIKPHTKPHAMPLTLQQRHLAVLEKALAASEHAKKLRQPLQWRKSITTSIETKTPRFQLDYTFKKDIDPDQDRVKVKQLTRQLKREKKAAMRELRRDSDFIDAERYKEQQEAKEHRRAERVKNFGFMEEQQATINLQVRKGGGLMKGGGSGVVKKSRVKRL